MGELDRLLLFIIAFKVTRGNIENVIVQSPLVRTAMYLGRFARCVHYA